VQFNIGDSEMMKKKLIRLASALVLLVSLSNAWGGCEAERDALIAAYQVDGDKYENVPKRLAEYKFAQQNPVTSSAARTQIVNEIAKKNAERNSLRINSATATSTTERKVYDLRINKIYPFEICLLNLRLERSEGLDQSSSKQDQQNSSTQTSSTNQPQGQQQSQQAQQAAQQNQARADQARQGKRKTHDPAAEAHHCIQPNFGGLYGGMRNTCNYKVWFTMCGYRPTENSWLRGMACEKQSFGSDSVGPGREVASHTKGVEMLYWYACKDPAWALDAEFVPGQGIKARCYNVGGGN